MKTSRILGVGKCLPEKIWTNNDLSKMMDTSDEWIQQRTGIQQRHWVELGSEISTSDLAKGAAEAAIHNAKINKSEIDLIVLCTLSPDHEFPGTACFLQAKLDLPGIPALDVRQQCTGFIYGLSIADQFIKTGMYKKVLVVGAEVHSKGLDRTTKGRDVAVLFGDGAGAFVVGEGDGKSQILSTHLHADGRFAKELWVKAPGLANGAERINSSMIEAGEHFPTMNGKTVFTHAVKKMPEAILEALKANGLSMGDVDLFLFHQANLRINEMVGKMLEIPSDKIFNTIQKYGNTTAATLPIGAYDAIEAGKLKPGMLVAMAAFGSGFTWGSALIRW